MSHRILRLTITPTFGFAGESKTRIDIIEIAGDDHRLTLTEWGFESGKVTKTVRVKSIDVERLIHDLTMTTITPLAPSEEVCDAPIVTLETSYWGVQSKFTWEAIPPDNWNVLGDVADKMCAMAGLGED